MAQSSRLLRMGLVWVIPIAAIALGLAFVSWSLRSTKTDFASGVASNVAELTRTHADEWARRQAQGLSVTDSEANIVKQDANGADAYTVRVLITQINSNTAAIDSRGSVSVPRGTDGAITTVTSCVEWQVNVSTKTVNELHAVIVRWDRGDQTLKTGKDLAERCIKEGFI